MALDPIEIDCIYRPQVDSLQLRVVETHLLHLSVGSKHEQRASAAQEIYLTADTARELFNWLGVFLHTGGR